MSSPAPALSHPLALQQHAGCWRDGSGVCHWHKKPAATHFTLRFSNPDVGNAVVAALILLGMLPPTSELVQLGDDHVRFQTMVPTVEMNGKVTTEELSTAAAAAVAGLRGAYTDHWLEWSCCPDTAVMWPEKVSNILPRFE